MKKSYSIPFMWMLGTFLVMSMTLLVPVWPGTLFETVVAAQSLEAHDLSNLRSADITDAQLRSYMARARSEGLSESQAFALARERGLPASEAEALRARIRAMEASGEEAFETVGKEYSEVPVEPEDRPAPRQRDAEVRRTFGSDVFREDGIAFEPSRQIPTPESYIVGPGDEIIVDIWGETTNLYRLEVSHEGTVSIDHLGPIYVHGLSISEVETRILDKLQTLYSGLRPGSRDANTFARISIGRLRSIQVTMIGEVSTPGDYTVSSLSTVYNALYLAGGPGNKGSYRNIRVVRDNEIISELDLYDFLIHGDQSDNIRLHDQDVIQVLPFRNRVEISGKVMRNGYFQMKEKETLNDLIDYAGGFTDKAYTRHVRIHRNTPIERSVVSVRKDFFGEFVLQNGDQVFIDEILDRFENRVQISGGIWRGGTYELSEGLTLAGLIKKADGLRPDVSYERGVIHRLREDSSHELISFDLRRLMNDPERYDIYLQREDRVYLPTVYDLKDRFSVSISGAVRDGGSFDFKEGMTLEDLILLAGGFQEAASEARIEISRRIIGESAPEQRGRELAEMFKFEVPRDLSIRDDMTEFELKPYDQIFVRRRPDYTAQQHVRIEGEVLYPGTYALATRNERISDLIERAGGLTNEAFFDGATLVRYLDRTDVDIDFTSSMERLDRGGRERRVGIDLYSIVSKPGSREDLMLREGDIIRIPERMQTVRVSGAVMQDVEIRYQPGKSLGYYIDRAGGFTENAKNRRAYVIYANGDVDRRKNYFFGIFRNNPTIQPGAEIIIPEKVERERRSTGEVIAISSAVISMASTVAIMIDRLSR
ncbi:SLBB domain-containing protein [Balneolaceae bacterium ANBcel3]|nr:SLBB domain-containing protein [Balneolaceae bacterium ANBcel3]